jgi:ATP-binding cassette subfamily C protein CydC
MRALLRILALWRARSGLLAAGAALSLAALACGVALMTLSGAVVAAVLTGALVSAGLWLRVLGPARVVLRYGERLVTHDATFRALADLRVWFFRGLAGRAAGGLGFRRAGDVLQRLVGDVEALDGVYLRILLPLAGALLLVPLAGLMAGRLGGACGTATALLFAAAAFALPAYAAAQTRAAGGALATASSALRVAALDALGGLREVRAFGAEARMAALVAAGESGLIAAQRRLAGRTAWANAAALVCGQAALLAVLLAAHAAPGLAVATAFLITAAFEPLAGLPRAGVAAGAAAAAAARVLELGRQAAEARAPAERRAIPQNPGLRFAGVHFAWAPDQPPVFDGLTLEVPAGARVAILGPSGVGKSTLAALALKVAVPQAGRVFLGGIDMAVLDAADVQHRVAWLGQATHLFDDTLRANLALGRPDATETELWEALDRAAIGALVRSLPDRLDTWLGEGGARLSGGQGRRVALARTLLQRAPVLILDEPCAGLDAETEREFLTTLFAETTGRTVILIAHRLTGAERLDRIWRLSSGHAVAAAA